MLVKNKGSHNYMMKCTINVKVDGNQLKGKDSRSMSNLMLDVTGAYKNLDFQTQYLQIVNYKYYELWAFHFRHFVEEFHQQSEMNLEFHDTEIDALLLAL